MENHLYNLMLQTVEENKSLWRIKNHYKKDAGDCAPCKAFWDMLETDTEQHVQALTTLIQNHIQ